MKPKLESELDSGKRAYCSGSSRRRRQSSPRVSASADRLYARVRADCGRYGILLGHNTLGELGLGWRTPESGPAIENPTAVHGNIRLDVIR